MAKYTVTRACGHDEDVHEERVSPLLNLGTMAKNVSIPHR